MNEIMNWFKPQPPPTDWRRNNNTVEKTAFITKAYKRMGFDVHRRHWEMTNEAYRKLQADAHRFYGCNLKRALRMLGCKNKVKYQTRNGYWVWMK